MTHYTIVVHSDHDPTDDESMPNRVFEARISCEDAIMWQALGTLMNHIGMKEEAHEAEARLYGDDPDIKRLLVRNELRRAGVLGSAYRSDAERYTCTGQPVNDADGEPDSGPDKPGG